MLKLPSEFLPPMTMRLLRLFAPRGLLLLRLLLLLLAGWWLLAPLSALLAQVLSYVVSHSDAVIVASFVGPMLCLCLILLGLWPRRMRVVLTVLTVLVLLFGLLQLVMGGQL